MLPDNFEIVSLAFEEALPFWENHLWKGRISPIRPSSTMMFKGGYDMSLKEVNVDFYGAVVDRETVGVISGFKTDEKLFRVRGIYVYPSMRRMGIGRALLDRIEQRAIETNCESLWSFPRKSAIQVYEDFGFLQASSWIDEGVEFGPNTYVIKHLK